MTVCELDGANLPTSVVKSSQLPPKVMPNTSTHVQPQFYYLTRSTTLAETVDEAARAATDNAPLYDAFIATRKTVFQVHTSKVLRPPPSLANCVGPHTHKYYVTDCL